MNIYKIDLLDFLTEISQYFSKKVHMVAIGGTALTLLDIKSSTVDIDFDIPDKNHMKIIESTFLKLGFKKISSFNWDTMPIYPYRMDIFSEGYIFCNQLLDDSRKNASIIFDQKKIKLFCLNIYDLIITKLLRSETRDLDDSIIAYNKLNLDILNLTSRYLNTASISLIDDKNVVHNFETFLKYLKNIKIEDVKKCQKLLQKWKNKN